LKWIVFLLAAQAAAQTANRFVLHSPAGRADVTWSTPSSFRYRRAFGRDLPPLAAGKPEEIKVTMRDQPEEYLFETDYLRASVRKDDLRVKVTRIDGTPLMSDATAAEQHDGLISWERIAEPGVRYYGLGAHTDSTLNLRGMVVHDATPFLFTTAGYGEWHVAPGEYDFDLERLRRGRYRIDLRGSRLIDYYFYFGPTPKEIFEERKQTAGTSFAPPDDGASLERMVELSLSGVVLPAPSIARFVPAELRARLDAYLAAYVLEVQDRGYPILHPLPFQFAGDPELDQHRDESMLGDELLVATGRSVYLPKGIWTDLKSNEEISGRKTIALAESPAVFARNGSIVPLAGAGTLELHYFPKLGAEFFLFDEDAGDYTQVHAAPAADIMRLEIESKSARDYTWVVHHLEGVKTAALAGGAAFTEVKRAGALGDRTWFYDAAAHDVRVRCRVAAGEDVIVNLSF
jgi:alpha-glucosidase (family GH31 glycosyl hydrolase)